MPVSTFRMVTIAFTMTAPLGSAMVPVRIAPTTWALAAMASRETNSATNRTTIRLESRS
jgi:hypothetical protein